MLKEGQLLEVFSHIVQEPVDQGWFDFAAEYFGRPDNGCPALLSGQTGR